MYKITSSEDGMRKIFRPKFWSLGTYLGYLGPVSQADPDERFSQPHFLVVWTPYYYPKLVVSETQAKNPKTIGAWCDYTSLRSFIRKSFNKVRAVEAQILDFMYHT